MTVTDNTSFPFGPAAENAIADNHFVVQSGEALTVPEGFGLLTAAFERQGSDLLLVAEDGSRVLIEDYFALAQPPALTTVGGAVLPADLVEMLAGPLAPGQYAQLEPGATAAPIGKVATAEGEVAATRSDGTVVALAVDDSVFQGDVLTTGDGASVGLVFNDDTTFALGESGRMVLDKLIYDPDSGEGESAFSVLQGAFVFVSGEIAANNPEEMVVRTPVATIGIRGTKMAGIAAPEGEENTFVLLPDEDGTVGSVVVINETGSFLVTEANLPLAVSSAFMSPEPKVMSEEEFGQTFGVVLNVLPSSPDRRGGNEEQAAASQAEPAAGGEVEGEDATVSVVGEAIEPEDPLASIVAELFEEVEVGTEEEEEADGGEDDEATNVVSKGADDETTLAFVKNAKSASGEGGEGEGAPPPQPPTHSRRFRFSDWHFGVQPGCPRDRHLHPRLRGHERRRHPQRRGPVNRQHRDQRHARE